MQASSNLLNGSKTPQSLGKENKTCLNLIFKALYCYIMISDKIASYFPLGIFWKQTFIMYMNSN